jgi:hypothetical protein
VLQESLPSKGLNIPAGQLMQDNMDLPANGL